jgi:RimJ/RimL family protein N-acetyltransferase
MDLLKFDEKQVRVKDIYGHTFEGVADYFDSCYSFHEYDVDEDMVRIEDWVIWESQIASIEEIVVHGTAEFRTERLKLRRYREEDAAELYEYFGTDPSTYQYSGWNPYATLEMSMETVRRFIESYNDEHFYGWVMDVDDVIVGTIGAYDYKDGCIEVGLTVNKGWRGRGFAVEALQRVLTYLTENEGISRVTAWCASENAGSRKAMEKAGMKLVREEKGDLTVADRTYDRLDFEYRKEI